MTQLRFALRSLIRDPSATCLAIVTLAVAIAAATIIASVIDVIWNFIPAVRNDRLVFVASTDPRPEQSQAGVSDGLARTGVSIPDLADLIERARAFETFAGFTFQSATLTGLDLPVRISTVRVTRNLLDVWGIAPQMGRPFTADESRIGNARVALLSNTFWQRQLNAAPNAIGSVLMLDGEAHTVVGVLPPRTSSGIFRTTDIFTPLVLDRERAARDDRRLFVTGVLKPSVTLGQAAADLEGVARQLQAEYPLTNAQTGVVVRPLIELLGGNITMVMFLLGLIALLVTAIACGNVSSIILAQTTARRRELAVRAALGASRFDQIRQLMLESAVMSSAAGALGLIFASWGVLVIRYVGGDLDGFSEMSLNVRVLSAAVALTVLAPFGFALVPALRLSKPDMDELRQGNRGAETSRGRRVRESLVIAQVALALMLMTQVGLIGRSTWKLHNLEKGFDPAQVLTLRMDLPEIEYRDLGVVRDFFTRAIQRIQALPGVTAAGATTRLPIADREVGAHLTIQGMPPLPPESQLRAAHFGISEDYLRTMRIPVIRGRGLSRGDFRDIPTVALVNQEAVRRYWPNQDAIGTRIAIDDLGDWIEVVGVVGNVRTSDASLEAAPQLYTPASWQPQRSMAFVVRTAGGDPTQIAPAIRRALAELDKNQPVYGVATMENVLIADLGGTYLLTGVLAATAVVALFLAAAGVYGLVSFSVSQRTREFGLRMALGARPGKILGMVVARGSLPMTIGLAVGCAGAAVLVSVTAQALEDVDVRDPIAYIVVSVPLVCIALLATYIPARRATQVDPLVALRAD
jgi:putative ABC transport system permease protein